MLTACTASKQLRTHRSALDRLTYGDVSPQEKFDGFATVLATVLDEATNFGSPVRTARYLQRFSHQNQAEITLLTDQLETHLNSLTQAQKIAFVGRAMTQPYGRQLLNLVPKVTKLIEAGDYKLGPLERTLGLFALKQTLKR